MEVLILGGNRYVGKRLAQLLVAKGMAVDLLNRGSQKPVSGIREQIKVDRLRYGDLEKSVQGKTWDVIYDFSCYKGKEAKEACEVFRDKTNRYVFISTVSVYRAGTNIIESGGGPSPNDYGKGKFEAEIEFSEKAPWPIVMVRFPIILGPDDYTKRLEFHVERVKNAIPIYFPSLDASLSFVQSEDAAHFLESLILSNAMGAINCASPDPVKLRTLMEWIEKATGVNAVYAESEIADNHSPFGIEEDWWINTDKLIALGFSAPKCVDWLPRLVSECVHSCRVI